MKTIELPIANESYHPTAEAMVRAIHRAGGLLARSVAQETQLTGATAFSDPLRASVPCANFATELHLPSGFDAATILDEVTAHYNHHSVPLHVLESANVTWPESLVSGMESRGFIPKTWRVFLLEHHKPPTQKRNTAIQIIPVRAAYGQLHSFFCSVASEALEVNEKDAARFAQTAIDHLDEPKLDALLARVDGQPIGIAGVVSLGQIGVLYNTYILKANRNQGVASALLNRLLDVCARSGMKQVIVDRADQCASIPFFKSIGFTEIASFIRYERP